MRSPVPPCPPAGPVRPRRRSGAAAGAALGLLLVAPLAGAAPSDLPARADAALARARDHLLSLQREDGSWLGSLESDVRTEAQAILTLAALGRLAPEVRAGLERRMAATQDPEGSWRPWPGADPDPQATRLASLALRDALSPEGRAAGARAAAWLAGLPPLAPDPLVAVYLALAGEVDWADLPYVSPRLVKLPAWFHPNLYDLSNMRLAAVALSILGTREDGKPRAPGGEAFAPDPLRDRAFVARGVKAGIFEVLTRASRLADRLFPPEGAREAALAWLAAHQEADGSFAGAFQTTALGALALRAGGPAHAAGAARAAAAILALQEPAGEGIAQQVAHARVWDTASVGSALLALGLGPGDPRLARAGALIAARQSLRRGDWARRAPRVPAGGFGFDAADTWYPNLDDTARALEFLAPLAAADPALGPVYRRALAWLLGMQSRDGGVAGWDRDDRAWLRPPQAGPFGAGDPSYPDNTARALLAFARAAAAPVPGCEDLAGAAAKARDRAVGFLARAREGRAWRGFWYAHYVYGTAEVLGGLRGAGLGPDHPLVRGGGDWLEAVQNPDGGFGESPASFAAGHLVPAPSCPTQTAYGLLGLVAAGRAAGPAAARAAAWLLAAQAPDGSWAAPERAGAVVPGSWYVRVELLPRYLAPRALAEWRAAAP